MTAGAALPQSLDELLPRSAPSARGSTDGDPPRTVLAWAERHRRIDARPFDLARFRPLATLYADPHPHICVLKPAPRGVSEFATNAACSALDRGAAAWY